MDTTLQQDAPDGTRPLVGVDWQAPMMTRPSQGEELLAALRRLFGRAPAQQHSH